MFFYGIIRFFTFPFLWAWLKIKGRDNKAKFHEKLGMPTEDRPKGEIIWVHCHDFAESAEILRGVANNMTHKILLTYNKRQGAGGSDYGAICQFAPIDTYLAVRNFLRFWEPALAVRIGSELRPRQLRMLKKNGIPSFLIDGKVSGKSYRRWKWAKRFARKIVRDFTFVWAADNKQVLRLANLGARDIESQELVYGGNKIKEILHRIRQLS
jgi:3-deoxy-D-manno-octulosonic-acid transferase